jgi:phosphoribosyl-ATP pyrophosphohydrolase
MDRTVDFLLQLEQIINQRLDSGDKDSYVNTLVTSGLDRVLKKIGEEAGEVIIAAKGSSKDELINESADLLFHLMLVLKSKDCSIQDVVDVLESRHNG